jgi:hypothetical protein
MVISASWKIGQQIMIYMCLQMIRILCACWLKHWTKLRVTDVWDVGISLVIVFTTDIVLCTS